MKDTLKYISGGLASIAILFAPAFIVSWVEANYEFLNGFFNIFHL